MKLSTQISQGYYGGWHATTYVDETELASGDFNSKHDAIAAGKLLEDSYAALVSFCDDADAKRARQIAQSEMLAKFVNENIHGRSYKRKSAVV